MRILLDNCVPRPIIGLFPGHSVHTAFELGWARLANGELMRQAAAAGFDLLVTADQNLRYQQNLATLPVSVLVFVSPRLVIDALALCEPHLPEALGLITKARAQGREALVRVSRDGIVTD